MRKNIFLCLLLGCLALSGCFVSPVVGSDEQRDPQKYGVFCSDAKKIIDEYSFGVLPKKEQVSDQSRYWYHYDCAFFGDPLVYVFLSTSYEEQVLLEEYERVQALGVDQRSLTKGRIGISLNEYFDSDYYFYTDSKIEDGRSLLFELAVFDFERREVQYLFFSGQDQHERKDEINAILKDFREGSLLAS